MQLTWQKSIRGALTAFTASLLGTGMIQAAGDSQLESSILLYSETDRVQAAEGIFNYKKTLKADRLVNVRFTIDGLTGASPNGATPSGQIQTFTRPSGQGGYQVKPGEIPLDDTFRDTRYSIDGSFTQPISPVASLIVGAHFSGEHDYTSFGANFGFIREFNKKNTTLSASAAYSHDLIKPEGGAPTPLSLMLPPGEDENEDENEIDDKSGAFLSDNDDGGGGSSESKNVFDAVVGLTQVLDRKTVFRINYSFSHSTGYLNDPYKILSIVQSRNEAQPGEPVSYIYEGRPDSHSKHAVYSQLRRYLYKGHTVDLSYRYFWDDWGITSHTVDFFYRLPLTKGHALRPHLRWYKQTAADFYKPYIVNGPLPVSASADYRLAPFHAVTVGMQYLFPVAQGVNLSIGGEYYGQYGDVSPPDSMGPLSLYEIFPDMDAVIVRMGFTYDF
ncbi:MAG: DUF3570 domain-containing protein [Candidatus Zixiibacteriota bacterium]